MFQTAYDRTFFVDLKISLIVNETAKNILQVCGYVFNKMFALYIKKAHIFNLNFFSKNVHSDFRMQKFKAYCKRNVLDHCFVKFHTFPDKENVIWIFLLHPLSYLSSNLRLKHDTTFWFCIKIDVSVPGGIHMGSFWSHLTLFW